MTLLANVHVVLVRPRWASNLGAVARVMKNFGLARLTLVDSRIGSWTDAHRLAVHAGDVLAGAVQLPELTAAVADATWLVATTNRAPAGMRVLTPAELVAESARRGAPTLLFGGEIHGLELAEMRRCHVASTIPAAAVQSSLNLAQAVAVYAASLFAAFGDGIERAAANTAEPAAPPELLQRLESVLGTLLADSRWAGADRRPDALGELLQPLWRANLTAAEVRAWLTALGKLARR
jgi:TrmH family RNA methyltransferase